MKYSCQSCDHCEFIWNSRDGVTPFSMMCPSCGTDKLYHDNWRADIFSPNYNPNKGQRVFVDMTMEKALIYAAEHVEGNKKRSKRDDLYIKQIAENIFQKGLAPDILIHGYEASASKEKSAK